MSSTMRGRSSEKKKKIEPASSASGGDNSA